ncbi:hypothetical protein ACT43S_13065 [Acinetobacter baumannii]
MAGRFLVDGIPTPVQSVTITVGSTGVSYQTCTQEEANENIRFKELPYSKFRSGTYSSSRPRRILKAKASSAKNKAPQARL